ncbi:MAG TPA: penicillin-binding protein 2 [Longimicrobiaceae bacterium]|nr:penicillin-binding protein 2 [Longimicrobiaceae bacterium]
MAVSIERRLRPANPFHPHSRRRRGAQATLAVGGMLVLLGAAFFRTQVVQNGDFVLRADDNRFRVVPIAAPRGTVYDRNGKIVAATVSGWTLSVEPGPPDSVRARVNAVAALLRLDSAAVEEVVRRSERVRAEPVLVSDDLTFEQVSWLEEARGRIAGVLLEARPVRRYPAGAAVAHLVGYVGEIDDRELAAPAWQGFRAGQLIGKAGVERQYERDLGGRLGSRYVEVDARGQLVGRFGGQLSDAPRPGVDVRLTLDLDLQRFIHHQAWPEGMRGAVVALVPSTGEILAMYSAPTYDPNLLVGGISPEVWRQLNTDAGRPLLNRVTHGIYPPGSTWKLATAIVGLERGAIESPRQRMPIPCTGGMAYAGRYSRCWKREGHGFQDLIGAIAHSCNVYFYQLGIALGLETLSQEGTRLGFSRRTGVDLPTERGGIFPTGKEWYVRRFGWRPAPSEVMSLAIGQGPNSQTPLRMAQFFSALAGDGTARAPHLLAGASTPLETDLRVSRPTLEAVRQGMAGVVEEGGTAHAVELRRWKLSGKTGTAQNAQDAERPHAWFTGFAGPRDGPPEVVVAVVVEFGDSGSGAAAPVGARVAEYYLNRKHGFPTPALPPLPAESTRAAAVHGGAAADTSRARAERTGVRPDTGRGAP